MYRKGKTEGREIRGISDHGFIHSIYFRDPNGYVIELTAKTADHDREMDPARNKARALLDNWQKDRARTPSAVS
jgi:catechol-2,3-dioxygenase